MCSNNFYEYYILIKTMARELVSFVIIYIQHNVHLYKSHNEYYIKYTHITSQCNFSCFLLDLTETIKTITKTGYDDTNTGYGDVRL